MCTWWILKSFGEYKHQNSNCFKKRHVQCMSQGWTICLAYTSGSHTFIGKHEKELDEKDLFVSLCETCLNFVSTLHQRATSAIWISHKKYQILILFWLFEWQIVLIRVQSNGLQWKTCVYLKAFRMVKHVTFQDFSGILVFENFLSIYLFKVNNGKTRIICQICSKLTIKKLRRY